MAAISAGELRNRVEVLRRAEQVNSLNERTYSCLLYTSRCV